MTKEDRRIFIDAVRGTAIFAIFKNNKVVHWYEDSNAKSFIEHVSERASSMLNEVVHK